MINIIHVGFMELLGVIKMTHEMSKNDVIGLGLIVVLVIAIAAGFFIGYPEYKIWKMDKAGQAQLAEAEWTKKIAIEEAKADLESSKLHAEATIVEARATAEANKIVAGSLDPMYINYLIAKGLTDGSSEVIYIPTEASIPIIDAGRAVNSNSEV